MRESRNYYSLELKHQVCKEHIEHGLTMRVLVDKYELSCHTLIHSWLRQFGYLEDTRNRTQRSSYIGFVNENTLADKSKKKKGIALSAEQKEIELLKKELEDAKMLAEGYRRMIELAEAELKVPIRKKPNTK